MALCIVEGLGAHHTGNLHEMHALVVVCLDDLLVISFHRTVAEALDGHLHITLSGTYPHLACKDIVQGEGLTIVKGNGQGLVAGSRGFYLDQPTTVVGGFHRIDRGVPRGSNRNGFTRFCPSPQTCFGVLLENHVVAKNLRQSYFSLQATNDCSQG